MEEGGEEELGFSSSSSFPPPTVSTAWLMALYIYMNVQIFGILDPVCMR